MRPLDRDAFATEAGARREVVDRLIDVDAIPPLPDGRLDARDEAIASTAQALLDSGIPLDALARVLAGGRFGLRAVGRLFSEPSPRTEATQADVASALGDDAVHLPAVYAAFGLPEPGPDEHPRADEARLVGEFVRLWSTVDPTGAAHVRAARLLGDGTRRIAEGWLDIYDEVALPDPTTQGAPTVGSHARPADPTDPAQNVSLRMSAVARELVSLLHERHAETSLHGRILGALEGVLVADGELAARPEHPPAIAIVDLSGFTSMTAERGDLEAATVADRLRNLAEKAVARPSGRVVKGLGDGVLLRFPDAASALAGTFDLVASIAAAGLPPAHAGIAAGRVVDRDGDVFGTTVNLAARMVDVAGAGEIVVEEGVVVALPAGTASFLPLGRQELKGLSAPVALWRATPPG
ncbi:MAG TPA: adenylate/guanylate cyclase domain-containing protein [Candidatus Limnocylindrales bacterium]